MADPQALVDLTGFFADLLAGFFAGFADRTSHAFRVFACAFNGIAGGDWDAENDEASQEKAAVDQRVVHGMCSNFARLAIGTPRQP